MFFRKASIAENSVQTKWRQLYESKDIQVPRLPFALPANGGVFCIGSCFARNIRKSLERLSIQCLPDYSSLQGLAIARQIERIDNIDAGEYHMNYYTPAAILQEFERSLSSQSQDLSKRYPFDESDFSVSSKIASSAEDSAQVQVWQDPARRLVFARDNERLAQMSSAITNTIYKGLKNASLFIITLGLIEQFFYQHQAGVIFFNQHPTYLGLHADRSVLKSLSIQCFTFDQTKRILSEIVSTIRRVNQAPIVFTVSPVPLERTFRKNMNIFEANMLSKSTLLSATRELAIENSTDGIYFFPSYEIASGIGSSFFQDRDLRHPKDEYVELITRLFVSSLKASAL